MALSLSIDMTFVLSLILQWLWVEFASCIGSTSSQDALTSQCSSLSSSKSQDWTVQILASGWVSMHLRIWSLYSIYVGYSFFPEACWESKSFSQSTKFMWCTIRSLPAGSSCTTALLWRRCDFESLWFFSKQFTQHRGKFMNDLWNSYT